MATASGNANEGVTTLAFCFQVDFATCCPGVKQKEACQSYLCITQTHWQDPEASVNMFRTRTHNAVKLEKHERRQQNPHSPNGQKVQNTKRLSGPSREAGAVSVWNSVTAGKSVHLTSEPQMIAQQSWPPCLGLARRNAASPGRVHVKICQCASTCMQEERGEDYEVSPKRSLRVTQRWAWLRSLCWDQSY